MAGEKARATETSEAAAPLGGAEAPASNGAAPTPVLGEFTDFASLHMALRVVREHRNISFETLDEIVGAPKGYFSHVLSARSERKITMQSLGWALNGLGVKAVLVDDPAMLKQISTRLKKRNGSVVRAGAVHIVMSRRFLSEIGRKGARVRNAQRRRRKAAARHAAMARWHGNGASK